MRNFIRSLALVVGVAVWASGALAAPVQTYKFNVNRFECMGGGCQGSLTYLSELNGQLISLTDEAVSAGVAGLTIEAPGGGSPVFIANSGIASMDLFPGKAELDASHYVIGEYWPEFLYASLAIGAQLFGSISHTDSSSTVVMTTGNLTGPGHLGEMFTAAHPLEWTGYVTSDRFSPWLRFTGEWVQVNTVPEPGSMALLLISLAGMVVTAKRARGVNTALAT